MRGYITKRDTERGSGQDRVVAAASLYGWTEVDYRVFDIPSSERAWVKDALVFYVRLGEFCAGAHRVGVPRCGRRSGWPFSLIGDRCCDGRPEQGWPRCRAACGRLAMSIPIKQVQGWHVERLAGEAIAQRLGRYVADAVLGSTREHGGAVVLHLNSGGNAAVAESWLRSRGYRVEPADYDPYAPGHYGVKIRVSPGEPLDELWCVGSGTPPVSVYLDDLATHVKTRGICSHCGRDMPVRGNGTLRKHQAESGTPIRTGRPAAVRLPRPVQDVRRRNSLGRG